MTQNATQAKNSRSFAEQSVFVSSIPSSMNIYGEFEFHEEVHKSTRSIFYCNSKRTGVGLILKREYVFTTAIYYDQLLRITLRPNMTYFWIKVLLLRPTFQLSYYCYGHTIITLSAKYIFSN